jgi:tetratricopeptide (TPR) repeat protein
MRPIPILTAACLALSSASSAQATSPISLYKDEHWLLHLHQFDPLPTCMLMATPTSNGELRRRLVVYVNGKANIARIEIAYPPQQYLAPNYPTTVAVDLGSTFAARSIRFRLLLHSTYPMIAARLSLSELEDIRLSLGGATGDMSMRFDNGETWRFPPPQERKLAPAAADCWTSAAVTDLPPGQDDDAMRCERHLSGCDYAAPATHPRLDNPLLRLGQLFVIAARMQYLFSRGNDHLHKGEYDRAIEYYDRAIRVDPSFDRVFNHRGLAYFRSRDYERAFSDFDAATRLNPTSATAFGNRGLVYNQRHQYQLAIRDCDRAIRLDAKNWQFFSCRGIAKRASGDTAGGEADLERARQLRPSYRR